MYLEPPFDPSEARGLDHEPALAEQLGQFVRAARGAFSSNTERAVRSDLDIYADWCARRGSRALPAARRLEPRPRHRAARGRRQRPPTHRRPLRHDRHRRRGGRDRGLHRPRPHRRGTPAHGRVAAGRGLLRASVRPAGPAPGGRPAGLSARARLRRGVHAVEDPAGDADAPPRRACRPLLPRREGQGRGVPRPRPAGTRPPATPAKAAAAPSPRSACTPTPITWSFHTCAPGSSFRIRTWTRCTIATGSSGADPATPPRRTAPR